MLLVDSLLSKAAGSNPKLKNEAVSTCQVLAGHKVIKPSRIIAELVNDDEETEAKLKKTIVGRMNVL